jgi:DNA-binding MarR family transcriptional regulator
MVAVMAAGGSSHIEQCTHALRDDLGWGLGVALRAYAKAAGAVMERLPGGPRSYQVLTVAGRDRPRTQLALATQLGVDRTVMTYLLDALETAGLVEREPDPDDRRARRVVVTRKGARLLSTIDRRLARAEADVLAPLDAAERATFRGLLQRVATHADTLDPGPPSIEHC